MGWPWAENWLGLWAGIWLGLWAGIWLRLWTGIWLELWAGIWLGLCGLTGAVAVGCWKCCGDAWYGWDCDGPADVKLRGSIVVTPGDCCTVYAVYDCIDMLCGCIAIGRC
jgi:hypothetical protein